jgi:biotin carboxyl carrier protein
MTSKEFLLHGNRIKVGLRPLGSQRFSVMVGDREHTVQARVLEDGFLLLQMDGVTHRCAVAKAGKRLQVRVSGHTYLLEAAEMGAAAHATAAGDTVEAPMTGTVLKMLVKKGDVVLANAPLVLLSAMKMEHRLLAPRAGVVAAVGAADGATVQGGTVLVRLEPA